MTHQIRVSARDIEFGCEDGETLLDAAERAGYSLPYSCRKGVCSSCEGGLIAGEAAQRGRGGITGPRSGVLFCQTRPRSDLEIAPKRIEASTPPKRKTIGAFVFRLSRPTPDVTMLHLRYPPQDRVRFRAGQYLQVLLEDGTRRNYSMAGPPQETDGTMLHVRRIDGGRFSEGMLAGLIPGSRLTVELPYGEFTLRDEDTRPAILLASGTGMAPVTSIVEDLIRRGIDRPLDVYWGVRREADLYLGTLPESWRARMPRVRYVPVLSRPDPGWAGRTGRVREAVLADHRDLSGHVVYACGNAAMVASVREVLIAERGLDEQAFHADAFVPSGD